MDPGVRRGLALVIVSAVSFGGVAVLTKLALASGLGVLALSFWRWGLAAAALAPLLAWRRALAMPRRAAAASLGLGLAGQAATSGLYTASLAHLPAAVGSFLLYLSPVFVALLAVPLLGERLTRRGVLSLALAMAGLALLALGPGAWVSPGGAALALASAVCYALTIVAARRLVAGQEPLRVALHLMVGATLAFGAGALATGTWGAPSPGTWPAVLLLAWLSTALSVGTFYLALPLIGAPRAALVSTLEPVTTVLVAWVVLGEVLSAAQALGAALVLGAVALLGTAAWPRRVAGRPGSAAP